VPHPHRLTSAYLGGHGACSRTSPQLRAKLRRGAAAVGIAPPASHALWGYGYRLRA